MTDKKKDKSPPTRRMDGDLSDKIDNKLIRWVKRQVESCSKPGCTNKPPEGEKFMVCGGCKSQAYCSAECQKANWKLHKAACKNFAASGAERKEIKNVAQIASTIAIIVKLRGVFELFKACKPNATRRDYVIDVDTSMVDVPTDDPAKFVDRFQELFVPLTHLAFVPIKKMPKHILPSLKAQLNTADKNTMYTRITIGQQVEYLTINDTPPVVADDVD